MTQVQQQSLATKFWGFELLQTIPKVLASSGYMEYVHKLYSKVPLDPVYDAESVFSLSTNHLPSPEYSSENEHWFLHWTPSMYSHSSWAGTAEICQHRPLGAPGCLGASTWGGEWRLLHQDWGCPFFHLREGSFGPIQVHPWPFTTIRVHPQPSATMTRQHQPPSPSPNIVQQGCCCRAAWLFFIIALYPMYFVLL